MSGQTAAFTPWDQVLAVEAPIVCHVVAFIAETGACQLVSVLIAALLTALANATVNEEVVADAPGALIGRLTLYAACHGLGTRLAHTLVQIVTFYASLAPKLIAILLGAVLDEAAFDALPIAHEESVRAS